MNLQVFVEKELEQRDELKHLVMVQVKTRCSIGDGHVKRGVLNQYVYQQLGFEGRPGNHFFRFMNKLMSEQGFRVSYSRGERVYFGLKWRDECQDQEELKKPNLENHEPEN